MKNVHVVDIIAFKNLLLAYNLYNPILVKSTNQFYNNIIIHICVCVSKLTAKPQSCSTW